MRTIETVAAQGLPSPHVVGSGQVVEYISLCIGDDQYGVPIISVREIKGWSNINPLPNQPAFVRGVLDLRGSVVPIVDLRLRFGGPATEATPTHVIIIVQIDDSPIGLLADSVLDIIAVDQTKVRPVPDAARGASENFLSGLVVVDGSMIALIDLKNLLIE